MTAPEAPPPGIVTLANEKPLRMSAVTSAPERPDPPIVDSEPGRPSAVRPYTSALSFSWRDQPLDKKPKTR